MQADKYREILNSWWQGLTDDGKRSAPILKNGQGINLRELFSDAPIKYRTLRCKYLVKEFDKINAELMLLGVLPDYEAYRKRLHNWWGELTDEEKKSVLITKNGHGINLRELFSDAPTTYQNIRKYLGKEFDKINTELMSLGVLADYEVYRERLNSWWNELTEEQKKSVPVAQNKSSVNFREFFSDVPIAYNRLRDMLSEDFDKIEAELKKLNVLSDPEVYRERLINWWNELTDEQKKLVPTASNTIVTHELFTDAPIHYGSIRRLLKEEFEQINVELKSLGVLSDVEAYRERLNNWWNELTIEQKKAVPILDNGSGINLRELFSDAPIEYATIRSRYLAKEFDKINAELKSLGVLVDVDAYRERLLNWWDELTDEQKLSVSVNPKKNSIDLRELFFDAGMEYSTIRKHLIKEFRYINIELKSLGVLVDYGSYRERLNNWWDKLTDEQKKSVSVSKDKKSVNLRELFCDVPIDYSHLRNMLLEDFNQIETELKELNVLITPILYRERLLNWWDELTVEQKKLSPIVHNSIDLRELFSDAPISYYAIRRQLKKEIEKINSELKSLGALADVEAYRGRLINWWNELTAQQKKSLPILNNTIDLRDLFNDVPISYYLVRQYLKEDIDKITAELVKLGVIADIDVYRERLLGWWAELTDEQKKSVPTSSSHIHTIDLNELFSDAPITHASIRSQLKKEIEKIDSELMALGALVDVEAYRKRLINWWDKLTNEQKKSVPTLQAHSTIDLRGLFNDVPLNYQTVRNYLKKEIGEIDTELRELGILFNARVYRKILKTWWNELTDEQKKLVPTAQNTIDLRDLFIDAPISYYTIRKQLKKEIKKIDAELRELGVLFDGEEYIERLRNWWKRLTVEQKKSVPTVNNSIDLHELFSNTTADYSRIRRYLKEDIDKIDAELKQLGILLNVDDESIEVLMRNFILECEANSELLWDVEFSILGLQHSKLYNEDPDGYFELYGHVSTTYLANKLSCKVKKLELPALLELRKQLNQLLLKHEISLPYSEIKGRSNQLGNDLNSRSIFLKWEKSLTDEEKLALPMHGKIIATKAFKDLIPIEKGIAILPLFKAEFQRLSSEVFELKGIDYKTQKEQEEIRKQRALEKEESKTAVFIRLRNKKLTSVDDFTSEKGHYEDVQHAFASSALKVKETDNTYRLGYKHYCNFLESKCISPESSFRDCFDSWSLRDFKDYLGDKIEQESLATSTANTYLSSVRITLNKLKTIRGFNFRYYPADGFEVVRNSIAYKPYSQNERQQIHKMLEQEMAIVSKKLAPYEKLDRKSANIDDPKVQARIIFEDNCNCVPVLSYSKDNPKGLNKLVAFARVRRLSLVEMYDEWGVLTRNLTRREIGIYVLKMAQVLGMNLNSILDLELDDYQKHHPLTNKPCLTYWKERSTGEKMLHLDLFHADLQWLTMSQQKFVEKVFDEVNQLTSEARKSAPDELSNNLFITYTRKVYHLSEQAMTNLYSDLVELYQLKDDSGEPMVLTTTRFRPTLVSELVDQGISIREIQYLLGHSSIFTTMRYLEQLDFDRVMREKARKAIEDIYSNVVHETKYNSSNKQHRRFDESNIIMKTPLGGCKNIFDPPDFIKKSSLYVRGKPCGQYNKCLSCENVMLTLKHLPELFAMQRDYFASLESGAVVDTPYYVVVLENLSLLDDILNPETSEFEEETLLQAKEDSLFIETTILDSWGV